MKMRSKRDIKEKQFFFQNVYQNVTLKFINRSKFQQGKLMLKMTLMPSGLFCLSSAVSSLRPVCVEF